MTFQAPSNPPGPTGDSGLTHQPGSMEPAAGAALADTTSRVGAALLALAQVKDAPPAEQVEPLTRVHRALRETLDSIADA